MCLDGESLTVLEASPHSSWALLSLSVLSCSAHRLETLAGPLAQCPGCLPLPLQTGCGCQEVEESVGSGWGVASGCDFLKPDGFATVSWAQDRTAVSYKCPCQSSGREALLPAEVPELWHALFWEALPSCPVFMNSGLSVLFPSELPDTVESNISSPCPLCPSRY